VLKQKERFANVTMLIIATSGPADVELNMDNKG
jgi:hypothetical protein